jgi:O-antigen/teichoic acid export membrane protein
LLLSASSLARLIFGTTDYAYELQLFAFTLITNGVAAVGLSYLRAKKQPVLFVGIGLASLVLQVALNIIFVVFLEMHVRGVVYSAVINGLVLATGLSVYVLSNVGVHFSKTVAIRLYKFAAPLILASLGAFYVAYADKYFIRVFGSLADVGLYALAARVSSVVATAYEAFNMSWAALRFEIVKKENAKEIYERVFRFLGAALFVLGAALSLFAGDLFRIMTKPQFYAAAPIVPVLILATITQIFTVFCNFGIQYRERTKYIAQAAWAKSIFATIGYFALIPHWGVYGAAITLALSNLFELAWIYRHSRRLYDMELRWKPVVQMLGAAVTCVAGGLAVPGGHTTFAIRVMLFCILMLAIYSMPVWRQGEKGMLGAAISEAIRFRLPK